MSVCECCCVFMHTFWLAASFGWNCMFCVSLFNVAYLWLTFKYVSVNNIFFCSLLPLLCIYTCSLWSFFACAHVFGFYYIVECAQKCQPSQYEMHTQQTNQKHNAARETNLQWNKSSHTRTSTSNRMHTAQRTETQLSNSWSGSKRFKHSQSDFSFWFLLSAYFANTKKIQNSAYNICGV